MEIHTSAQAGPRAPVFHGCKKHKSASFVVPYLQWLHCSVPGSPHPCINSYQALVDTRSLNLLTLLPHKHWRLAIWYQEPTATHASGPQTPHFTKLVHTRRPASSQCTEAYGSPLLLTTGESQLPVKELDPVVPPLSSNLLLFGCQEICLPIVYRVLELPTTPKHGRVPTPLSKSRKTTSPIEGRKAVICYSVGGTGGLSLQGAQKPIFPIMSA
jgi:hypothetical protein